jgi:hypothetical protein
LTKNQATKQQIKDLLLDTMKKQNPETTKELCEMVQQASGTSEQKITKLLIELENEDRLRFNKKEMPFSTSPRAYFFSSRSTWYWAIIVLALVTTITIFVVPKDTVPFLYVRSALGVVFVLFLPGFAFMKALYPTCVPVKTFSENLGTIERVALSLGMSLALTPIVGLILNYTPWGIRLTPITLSLLAWTAIVATVAAIREYRTRKE